MVSMNCRGTAPLPRGRYLDAKIAAYLDSLEHQESQERMDAQASQAHLVHLDSQANHHWRSATPSPHHHASRALQDPLDQLAHQDHQEDLDPMAHQETQARMEVLEPQARPVPQAQQEQLARMERKDHPAPQPQALHQHQAMLDPQEKMARQDLQARTENQAQMEDPVQPVPKVHQAQLVPRAVMEHQEIRDPLVQMEKRVNLVYVPSIVPLMVVCSSRMAQGDKRP